MAGRTKSSVKKGGLRSGTASSQTATGPSSGATVLDDTMNIVNGHRLNNMENSQDAQASQTTQSSSTRFPSTSSVTTRDEIDPLGEGVRDLITTMSELEKLGLANDEIQLPKCVVCGDQSAGKSSVIEAISGIQVPRSGGTCTRCPMFVQLACSTVLGSRWKAKVSLRKTHNYAPHAGRKMWDKNFEQWQEIPTEESLFAHTDDQNRLGSIIHGAQLAILNPGKNQAFYVPGTAEEIIDTSRQAEFSPNVICVYISAPGLPSLSFYDLPGVIIARGNKSKEVLKKFIDNLVTKYIRDSKALVLLTSSLEIDWDIASNAAELVSKAKATGRCIGVLTKPDRIDTTSRWTDIQKALEGEADVLGHGYFVVKQPSQEDIDRNITRLEAREAEEEFFDQQEPWAGKLSTHRERFGTRNLQTVLSKTLAGLSIDALPTIEEKIDKQLACVQAELDTIPRPPTKGVTGIVRDLLKGFTGAVRKEMRSKTESECWRITWDRFRKELDNELQSLAPRLKISGTLDRSSFEDEGPAMIDLCSDDDDGPHQPMSLPATPKKRKLEQPSAAGTPSRNLSAQGDGTPATKKAKLKPNDFAILYNLDETRARLDEKSSAKLAHQVNPKAIEMLMRQPLHHWKELLTSFFMRLERALSGRIQEILLKSLEHFLSSQLFKESTRIVQEFITLQFDLQRTTKTPDNELKGPWINHQVSFNTQLLQFSEKYKGARRKHRSKLYFQIKEERTGKPSKPTEQLNEERQEPLKSALDNDPYAQEVQVIAQVRAYYELASTRFFDSICVSIEAELFEELGGNLFDHLRDGLHLTDENEYQRCIQLLADDPGLERRRQNLDNRKAALLAGQECVNKFRDKYRDARSFTVADETNVSETESVNHEDGDEV